MCNECSKNKVRVLGMGNAQPLQKVETYTAPIVTFPTSLPTAPVKTTNVYVPQVKGSLWNNILGVVTSAANYAAPLLNPDYNRLGQQNQYANAGNFVQQAPAPQNINPVTTQGAQSTGVVKFIAENQLLSAGIAAALVVGTVYIVKK